jgi:hypothetical protein
MQWRLLKEEFGPELIYNKGTSNVVADALSRLNITSEPMSRDQTVVADLYGATTKDIMFPITFPTSLAINNETQPYVRLLALTTNIISNPFVGAESLSLLLEKERK